MNMSASRKAVFAVAVLCLVFLLPGDAFSQATKPSAKDKCPVCGMFVAEYGEFLAEIAFKDGFRAYFDGPKDMFRYYFEPEKYHPGRKTADIASVYVTDYYSLEMIDGQTGILYRRERCPRPDGQRADPYRPRARGQDLSERPQGKIAPQVRRGHPGTRQRSRLRRCAGPGPFSSCLGCLAALSAVLCSSTRPCGQGR